MGYLLHIFFMVYFLSYASLFEVEQSKMSFRAVAAEPVGDPFTIIKKKNKTQCENQSTPSRHARDPRGARDRVSAKEPGRWGSPPV